MIFQSAANDFPFCTDLFRPSPEQNCNQVARQIVVCLAFFPYLCSHENENRRNDEETTPCHHLVMALHVDAGRFGLSPSPSCPYPLSGTGDGIHPSGQEYTCLYVGMYHAFPVDDTFVRLLFSYKKPYPTRLSYFGRHATFQLFILYKYRAGLTTLTGLICIFPDPSAEKA